MNPKKISAFILATISLYGISVIGRSYFFESAAEDYVSNALNDFSNPWNAEKLWVYASQELKNDSMLPPGKLAPAVESEIGNLIKITGSPDCELNSGTHRGSIEKHIYAVCELDAKFEKKAVHMKIRLVEEGPEKDWKIFNFVEIK